MQAGESGVSVAEAFNIGPPAIYRMRAGLTWRDVTGLPDLRSSGPPPPHRRGHTHRWRLEPVEAGRKREREPGEPLTVEGAYQCGARQTFAAAHAEATGARALTVSGLRPRFPAPM